MAPNEGRRRDPNLIDVSLSLWPGQSEQAMTALAQSIAALNEHLQAADLPNAVANIQGINRVIDTYKRQDQVYEGGRSPTAARTQGGAGTVSQPDDAAGQAASRNGPEEAVGAPTPTGMPRRGTPSGAGDDRVEPHERRFRERLGQWNRIRAATQGDPFRERVNRMADVGLRLARPAGAVAPEDMAEDPAVTGGVPPMGGGGSGGDGGERSAGASAGGPDDPDPRDPALGWVRHARLQNLEQPISFPRFGELTTQDKLRMASDWLARSQLQRNDRAAEEGGGLPGQWRGRASAALSIAANNYAQYRVVRDHIERFGNAIGLTRAGEEAQAGMGYSQAGGTVGLNVPGIGQVGGEIPIVGPLFSEAGRQNIRREFEIRRLAAQPQISGEQARAIMDTINQLGYSGGEADNLAFRLYAPLARQGASAQAVGQVTDEAYRYGNASIDALRESLEGLGGAARNTRQSVDQVIEGLGAFAQTAAEHGATVGRGLATGREFMAATGQRAEVGARALDNPLFQGLAMQRTGLLPTQQGTMTGTEIADVQADMVRMSMQMTRGFNRPRTETVTDAHGREISRQRSGREAQIAQAAALAGMDVETFRQTLRHQDRQSRYSAATTALEAWADDVRRSHAGSDTGGTRGQTTGIEDALQRGAGGRNRLNWNEVAQELAEAGVSRERIRDISGHKFGERVKLARQELEKRSDEQRSGGRQTVDIRLTGMAEKLFQAKLGGGNKFGHSDTSAWKTAAGIGVDVFKLPANPAGAASDIAGRIGDLF